MIIQGKVWKYKDNINTDLISPPTFMELSIEEAAQYTLSPIDPDFAKCFKKGDFLVAEENLGSGSSRETAPLMLKALGVKVIIAKSYARIFYRNCINLGILALECKETDKIDKFDVVEIDTEMGQLKNITKNESHKMSKVPGHLAKILEAGGLVPHLEASMVRHSKVALRVDFKGE